MTLQFDDAPRARMLDSIKRFFSEELDDEIGDLKARLALDFVLDEIGPTIYNHAIKDAQAWFHGRVEDLEGSCWEPEFAYFNQQSPGRRSR